MVSSIKWVDAAVLGYEETKNRIVHELQPDIIALGYDQSPEVEELANELREEGLDIRIVRLDKRTGDIQATSDLLARIKKEERC